MKIVTTNHPIIVNGVKESKPSDYLSANGDFYEARGRKRKGWRKAVHYIPAVAIADTVSNADGVMTDVISTKNPIVVDGKYISNPTWYLAEGNKGAKANNSVDDYYGMDGDIYSYIDKKNTVDVKAFQTYANGKGAKLVVDGIWGAKTQAQYDKYGAEWEATKNPVTTAVAPSIVANAPVVPQGATPTATQVADAKKKGLFWDKVKGAWVYAKEGGILDWVGGLLGIKPPSAFQPTPPTATTTTTTTTNDDANKGMSKTTKTLLMVGGALVLGFVIFEIAKKKK
jgi:hypothetical protein